MSQSNANNPHLALIQIGDISAGSATVLPGLSLPKKSRIRSVKLINNAALSGDDTNNVQVELKEGGTSIATHLNDVASGGLAQRVGKSLALAAGEELRLKDADLIVDISHNGSGAALTAAVLQVELYSL